jgi:hypothetical protein
MLKGKLLNTLKPVKHETKDNNKPVPKTEVVYYNYFSVFGIVDFEIQIERPLR